MTGCMGGCGERDARVEDELGSNVLQRLKTWVSGLRVEARLDELQASSSPVVSVMEEEEE